MSSLQNSDLQYEQLQAAWVAAQNVGGPVFGGGYGQSGFERGLNMPRFGEVDHFNRSSIRPFGQPSSSTSNLDFIARVIAQADHDTLLKSGNEAFAKVLAEHNGTKEELASLRRAFEVLVQTRSDSSLPPNEDGEGSALAIRRPSGIPRRRAYRKEDVPHIKFWTRKDYEESKSRTSAQVVRNSKDSQLAFMEREDGTPITEEEASKMRLTARGVFAHLLSEGNAPAKWGQVSVVSQDFFFNVLSERYPHAAMCEDMWKLQLLATLTYPSWYRHNKEKIHGKHEPDTPISELDMRKAEKEQQERVWIQQQLEHGRQLKGEVIEHVQDAVDNLKRNRAATENSRELHSRPNKKSKAAPHEFNTAISGTQTTVSGPLLAPQFPAEAFPINYPKHSSTTHPRSTQLTQMLPPSTIPLVTRTLVNRNESTVSEATAVVANASVSAQEGLTAQSRDASTLSFDTSAQSTLPTAVRSELPLFNTNSRLSVQDGLLAQPHNASTLSFDASSQLTAQDGLLAQPQRASTLSFDASSQLSAQDGLLAQPQRASTLSFDTNSQLTAQDRLLAQPQHASTLSFDPNSQLTAQDGLLAQPQHASTLSFDANAQLATQEGQRTQQHTFAATLPSTPTQPFADAESLPVVAQQSPMIRLPCSALTIKPSTSNNSLSSSVSEQFDTQETSFSEPPSLPLDAGIRLEEQRDPSSLPPSSAPDTPTNPASDTDFGTQGHSSDFASSTFMSTQSLDFDFDSQLEGSARNSTPSVSMNPEEPTASPRPDPLDAELLRSIGYESRPSRPRPTPREHPAPTEGPDTLFDLSTSRVRGVRNPLGELTQPRVPSTNVNASLEPTYLKEIPEDDADKENLGKRGRGRPANKDIDPDKPIRPNTSSSARNIWTLTYKEKHGVFPTDRMWKNLTKAEADHFEALSKDRKKASRAIVKDGTP